jgi:hypothetical protein
VALLRGDPDARLATGWRADLLGDGITRLMDGRSGMTFDGRGSLKLVDLPVADAPATNGSPDDAPDDSIL